MMIKIIENKNTRTFSPGLILMSESFVETVGSNDLLMMIWKSSEFWKSMIVLDLCTDAESDEEGEIQIHENIESHLFLLK